MSTVSEEECSKPSGTAANEPKILVNFRKELVWMQNIRAEKAFNKLLVCLRDCCARLHITSKLDERVPLSVPDAQTERVQLTSRVAGDSIRATITLLAENVIQAEVQIKHAKSPGGVYRAVAQPDVQWKLQQVQDVGNQCARAYMMLIEARQRIEQLTEQKSWSLHSADILLQAIRTIKEELTNARASLLLPRKRSLLELCHFQPTRCFNPPLPSDLLLSLYVSSSRLVLAAYQMLPKTNAPQSLSVCLADAFLPQLNDVLVNLNTAITLSQELFHHLSVHIEQYKHVKNVIDNCC